MKVLVTGGAGFIGSAVVRHVIGNTGDSVVNVDKLSYAGDLESVAAVSDSGRYAFEQVDICDRPALERVFRDHRPDAVMHLAAESHVDRSIRGPAAFIETNLVGTYTLLETAREYRDKLPGGRRDAFRFHHVSTDEVYGDLGDSGGRFSEDDVYRPSSPYSASKAGADHLVRAWHRTYGLPVVVSNCSNNYGPFQYPEKLIPLTIHNALEGKPLPVYGRGEQVRDWLYVEDHALALYGILTRGRVGETYNVGGDSERRNLDVVHSVCSLLDELVPRASAYRELVSFVEDRPGHDRRYAIDAGKIRRELGWAPKESLESGLEKTVRWYLDHREWMARIAASSYGDWIARHYGARA